MYRVVPSGRSPRVRTLLVALVLLGLVGAFVPSALSSHGTAAVPISAHPTLGASHAVSTHSSANTVRSAIHSAALHPSTPTSSTHPAGTGTGVFWGANSSFSQQSFDNAGCTSYSFSGYFSSNCYTQAVSPTVLNLANGDIAIVYSIYTNASGTACLGSASSVSERVAISLSSDGGQTFGPIQYLGNMTCAYLDAIEPSFAVASDGTVYGAYVEYNYSGNQGQYTSRSSYYCCSYANDALGFTESSDNGVTFSAPLTINSDGNISKPQVAVFGDTVYVLYENISNGTSYVNYGLYGYYSAPAINENLLVSTDGGATWSGPTQLPGVNPTWNDNEVG
ncbi:MAG: glycoside hydrolase, partial [Thermoplasmata archaeon]|nr:glycoside hydrolase [Thermoplasmata archaeon]